MNTQQSLVDKNERILFFIILMVSLTCWVTVSIITKGMILLIIPFIFIIFLFAQSGFISHLRGTGAVISDKQFPDLHMQYEECLSCLGFSNRPEMILIHADGVFNALATRFLRKNYVVLYSDVVDALQDEPEAVKFYIGHELGHIKQKHLLWGPLLAIGEILPLIGAGYSRAQETTCDLHGLACCNAPDSAMRAMAALSVGARRWKEINFEEYLRQLLHTKGFFMSFHEIIGSYPWLVKRMARVAGMSQLPRRNPLAYLLAIWVPKFSIFSAIMLYVFILAIMASYGLLEDTPSDAYEETAPVEQSQSYGESTIGTSPDTPAQPKSQEEYDALPPGTFFVNPEDGELYKKP